MSPLGEEPENGAKKEKPPNLDILAGGNSGGEQVSLGSNSKSNSGSSSAGSNAPKSPRVVACPTPSPEPTNKSASAGAKMPQTGDVLPESPRIARTRVTGDGFSESSLPGSLPDSPKRFPDSPLRAEHKSKQTVLQERLLESRRNQKDSKPGTPRSEHKPESDHGTPHSDHEYRTSHGDLSTPRSKHGTPRGEHKQVMRSDSSVSQRKASVTDSDDDRPRTHHHHHRSPKRAMSERRRSQRSVNTNVTEHRRASSVGGPGGRRASMRISERRRSSIYEHGTVSQHRRLSHDRMSVSGEVPKSNGSPVHIEYYKKPSHPSGPYMSPGLSSAYKTPAAEILIASLIIGVGLVALITSVATGIHVWMVVGGVCVGLGAMFMLLGLCWYCALARQKRENEDLALKVLNSKQLMKLARTSSNVSQHPPQMV